MGFSLFGSKKEGGSDQASIWTDLSSTDELEAIIESSAQAPQVIFKHSTRCIISRTVLKNFEAGWPESGNKGSLTHA